MAHTPLQVDVAVIGSGFGGSVAALRAAEKGYRVTVLEAGERFDDPVEPDPLKRHRRLPATSWRLRRFLWAPRLGLRGIQRIHLLRGERGARVLVLAGAGVGGGSLVYGNTLYRPPRPFYDDPQWSDIADWESELAPHYDTAERMLGVVDNPIHTPADDALRRVAERMGVADTYRTTRVGIHIGLPGERVADPYFGGDGPGRAGCVSCGGCMTGCRFGAKNMLTENYLYLAERRGATIVPRTTVTAITPTPDGPARWRIDTSVTGVLPRRGRTVVAEHVVIAAGTYGTQRLLHRMRATGRLPGLSGRLGALTRTNSEAILGAMRLGRDGEDHSRGIAITSSIHPNEHTHVEPVRYGRGSNAMGALGTLLVDGDRPGDRRVPRWRRFVAEVVRHPVLFVRSLWLRDWSRRTVIGLVMQSRDNSVTVGLRRGRLHARLGHGEPNPTWLPVGHEAVRHLADELGAQPGGTWLDVVDVPTTAHFLGGCAIGADASTGVIDAYHRVFGHDGLHIMDGSAVSANLGVNPSLTITAQAERAMSMWPDKDAPDPRPPLGEPYRPIPSGP